MISIKTTVATLLYCVIFKFRMFTLEIHNPRVFVYDPWVRLTNLYSVLSLPRKDFSITTKCLYRVRIPVFHSSIVYCTQCIDHCLSRYNYYTRVCNKSNTTEAMCEVGTAYPSVPPEFIPRTLMGFVFLDL